MIFIYDETEFAVIYKLQGLVFSVDKDGEILVLSETEFDNIIKEQEDVEDDN